MKIGIIGAGNMGGAIARGLINSGATEPQDIYICCPNGHGELDSLREFAPLINTSTDNALAAKDTDLVIIATKPWLVDSVMKPLLPMLDAQKQMIASVAAGVTLEYLESLTSSSIKPTVFRIMPNTAIMVGESMTFVASSNATDDQEQMICALFEKLGKVELIEERLMGAATSLASCGIAYVMRYIRASCEGGVELGLYPDQAKRIMLQTMQGAVSLLDESGNHPEAEIDRVTTPGGITIKGLNALEKNGFSTAVIEALKASTPTTK